MVQDEVLAKIGSEEVEAFVVWIPTFPGDDRHKALAARSLVPDRRARHFWDGERRVGARYHRTLELPERVGLAWDVYFVFDSDSVWGDEPPLPSVWQHQLSGVDARNRLDGETLRAAVERALAALASRP